MAHAPDADEGFAAADEFFIYKYDRAASGLAGLSFDEGTFGVFGYIAKVCQCNAQCSSNVVGHAAGMFVVMWLVMSVIHAASDEGGLYMPCRLVEVKVCQLHTCRGSDIMHGQQLAYQAFEEAQWHDFGIALTRVRLS